MSARRLETLGGEVIAIFITIMVLQLPHGAHFGDLRHTFPSMFAYALSVVYLGVYRHRHHHLLRTLRGYPSHVVGVLAPTFLAFALSLRNGLDV